MAKIVIVSADELTAELASEMLNRAGHICGWVDTAAKAQALLGWRRPDVVVIDEDAADAGGRDLVGYLRRTPRLRDVPVVLLTSVVAQTGAAASSRNGMATEVGKPFDQKTLRTGIERALAATDPTLTRSGPFKHAVRSRCAVDALHLIALNRNRSAHAMLDRTHPALKVVSTSL